MTDRRSYLALAASTLSLGVAGCIGPLDLGGDDEWAGVDPAYPDDRDLPADAATHHLFVENADGRPYPLVLTVVRTDAGEDALVWRQRYEAPDERGFEIPELLVEGRTYEITAAIEDRAGGSTTREIEPCPGEGGSRNVGVWIEDGTIAFRQDSCDEIVAGATLPIGDHASFTDG